MSSPSSTRQCVGRSAGSARAGAASAWRTRRRSMRRADGAVAIDTDTPKTSPTADGVRTRSIGPDATTAPCAQQHGVGGEAPRQVEVVQRHRHRVAVVGESAAQRQHVERVRDVEAGGRLVEQQVAGLGRQAAGDEHALALAARQRGRVAIGDGRDVGAGHGLRRSPRDRRRRSRSNRPRWACRPIATISRTVKAKAMWVSCGTSATARASARRGTRASGAPSSVTVPSVGAQTPASRRSSVLLPGSVRPDQRHQPARARPGRSRRRTSQRPSIDRPAASTARLTRRPRGDSARAARGRTARRRSR